MPLYDEAVGMDTKFSEINLGDIFLSVTWNMFAASECIMDTEKASFAGWLYPSIFSQGTAENERDITLEHCA